MEKKPQERIEWSGGTPLVVVIDGGWANYPEDAFTTEHIINMRMREYAMGKDTNIVFPDGQTKTIPKEDLQVHLVIGFGEKPKDKTVVFQPA